MEYLDTQLTDGTTYGDFVISTIGYRKEKIDVFANEILFSPMDENDIKERTKQLVDQVIPDRSEFVHAEDYDEVFAEVYMSFKDTWSVNNGSK